jgi:chromosome segregation ATPase
LADVYFLADVYMKTPIKIMMLLFTLTLAFGTLVLLYASDDSLHRFRWFVFNDPLQLVADVMLGLRTSNSLWYGWISLSAMIMVGVTIKLAMNAELRAFSNRLVEAEVAKAELESALQDSLWKEKHARGAKDTAMKDLEATVGKLMVAEHQLIESNQLVNIRDKELNTLRSQVNILADQPGASGSVQQQQELRDELRLKTELLQAKDAAVGELEKNLNGKVHALETQLITKEQSLKEYDNEIKTLQQELNKTRAARTQAENLLAEELKKEKQGLQAKDSAIKELERNLAGKIRTLTTQLGEKQDLLQSRSLELEALKAEVNTLTKAEAEAASARDRAENVLQQELKKKTELLMSKDAAFKELRESSTNSVYALENQLNDKEKLLSERDKELETLKAQLTRTGAAKNQVESSLAEELRKEREALRTKDSGIKELEKEWRGKLHALETQMSEKQELLQIRSTELESLKSEVNLLTTRVAEAASTKERAEKALQQELKKNAEVLQSKDLAFKELQTNVSARFRDLETQISAKESSLNEHNAQLDALRNQLTKMGAAKQDVEDLLRKELDKTKAVLETKDSAIKQLEESLSKSVKSLENKLRERDTLLSSRDGELEALRSEVGTLKARLIKMTSTPVRTEGLPQEKISNEATLKELEEGSKRIRALEGLLSEKEEILKHNDEKMERLESELKEKRKELARHEIEVWQDIEKRGLWKRRLAKFGISLKD